VNREAGIGVRSRDRWIDRLETIVTQLGHREELTGCGSRLPHPRDRLILFNLITSSADRPQSGAVAVRGWQPLHRAEVCPARASPARVSAGGGDPCSHPTHGVSVPRSAEPGAQLRRNRPSRPRGGRTSAAVDAGGCRRGGSRESLRPAQLSSWFGVNRPSSPSVR
jgi:hypothetical protein